MKRNCTWYNIVILLILIFFTGCLPEAKRITVRPEPEVLSAPVLPVDEIDDRINKLKALLQSNKISEDDVAIVEKLISDYDILKSINNNNYLAHNHREIINILFQNLGYLDERYFIKDKSKKEDSYFRIFRDYSEKRKKILDSYLSNDYKGVIADCAELELTYGPDSLTPEIGLVFAVSLAKNNMLEEAINVGERIVKELENRPDLIHLRANIIEWQLQMGNRDIANQLLEKLTDNIQEKENIYEYVKNIVNNKATYYSADTSHEEESIEELSSEQPDSMEQLISQINRLMLENRYDQAKEILLYHQQNPGLETDLELIDQALKTVEIAEEKYQERLSDEQEKIKNAKRLIEEENFEEAITKIENIENSGQDTTDLKKMKADAIEKLIDSEAERASMIVLKARKTQNPEKKKQLLYSSYEILNNLIEKYPNSPSINDIKGYLELVMDELKKAGG